jgi:hypothetical protein
VEGVVHLFGTDADRRKRFAGALGTALRVQGHAFVTVAEEAARERLGIGDNQLLAALIAWMKDILEETNDLMLISVSPSLSRQLLKIAGYAPDILVGVGETEDTPGVEHLGVSGMEASLTEDVARVLLALETAERTGQAGGRAGHRAERGGYTPEEEAAIEDHLRALGYL